MNNHRKLSFRPPAPADNIPQYVKSNRKRYNKRENEGPARAKHLPGVYLNESREQRIERILNMAM